jgi:hypothetical protein
MIKAIDLLEISPVIAAIKDDAGLKNAWIRNARSYLSCMEISAVLKTLFLN